MPIERFKDVTVNGRDYRVGLVTADIGNWIVLQMSTGRLQEFEVFQKVKTHLLNQCSAYVGGVPMSIFADGRWLMPTLELEYDLESVNGLLGEATAFNFDPFFERRKKEAEEKSSATNP